MGTDIYMIAEVRNPKTNKWEVVKDPVFPDSHDPDNLTCVPYTARNYNLFAILANVRNGTGFAGCITGETLNTIAPPKGYPEDGSDSLKRDLQDHPYSYYDTPEYEDYPHVCNGYGASYYTLQELLDFNWEQPHRNYGALSEEEFKESVYKGKYPQGWSAEVWGDSIITVSEQEMRDIIEGRLPKEPGKHYYVHCVFPPRPYATEVGSFYSRTIPALKKLIPEGGTASDVRIIFDFDC